jgi:hypothetical protein
MVILCEARGFPRKTRCVLLLEMETLRFRVDAKEETLMSSAQDVAPKITQISAQKRSSSERLLATSETMSNAPRLKEVLKFIVDQLVQAHSDKVSEQKIGGSHFQLLLYPKDKDLTLGCLGIREFLWTVGNS